MRQFLQIPQSCHTIPTKAPKQSGRVLTSAENLKAMQAEEEAKQKKEEEKEMKKLIRQQKAEEKKRKMAEKKSKKLKATCIKKTVQRKLYTKFIIPFSTN